MPDWEKVIKGLECCLDEDDRGDNCWENGDYPACPYNGNVDGCMGRLERDALALLKAQEPLEPVIVNGEPECAECRYELRSDADSYCPCCGRKVKWE